MNKRSSAASTAITLAAATTIGLAAPACEGDLSDPPPRTAIENPSGGTVEPVNTLGYDPNGIKRTVETRNPLGGPLGNLMIDGDFELSITPDTYGQYGWYHFSPSVEQLPILADTGSACRTGLRCAVLDKYHDYIGFAVAAPGLAAHEVSMWLHPAPGSEDGCNAMNAIIGVWTGSLGGNAFFEIQPPAAANAEGWCHFQISYPAQDQELAIIVTAKEDGAVLDSVSVLPTSGGAMSPQPGPPPPDSAKPKAEPKQASPEAAARARTLLEHVMKSRRFGGAPPKTPPHMVGKPPRLDRPADF